MNKEDYKNFINSIKLRDNSHDRIKQKVMDYRKPAPDYLWIRNIRTAAVYAAAAAVIITAGAVFQKNNMSYKPHDLQENPSYVITQEIKSDTSEKVSDTEVSKDIPAASFSPSPTAAMTLESRSPAFSGTPSATGIQEYNSFTDKEELFMAVKKAKEEYGQSGKSTGTGLEKLDFYFDFAIIPDGFVLKSINVKQGYISVDYYNNTDPPDILSLTWDINQDPGKYIQELSGALGPDKKNIKINDREGLRSGTDYYWSENGFCFSVSCPLTVYGKNAVEVFFRTEKIDVQ